jgi:hypothetical protein
MKRIALLGSLLLAVAVSLFADISAITDDGKKVILKDNKTWDYAPEAAGGADFRGAKWGMTKDEVKASEKAELMQEQDDALFYDASISGIDCVAIYIFAKKVFVRAKYFFSASHTNLNDYIMDYFTINKLLVAKYQEPTDSQIVWKDDLYKSDESSYGLAISAGMLVMYSTWENETTTIEQDLWGDNFKIRHEVHYTSKELHSLEENQKAEEALEQL